MLGPFATRVFHVLASLGASLLLSGTAQAQGACDCSGMPTLGRAAFFPALGLDGTHVELLGSVFAESTYVGPATDGNIAVGSGGTVLLQGAAKIQGFVAHHWERMHQRDQCERGYQSLRQ